MKIVKTITELSEIIHQLKTNLTSIGFVPTMGALHEGHGALIQQAISENETVICSIFVNPTQFNKTEDLEKYPRKENEDITYLKQLGCNILFLPTSDEIYNEYTFPGIILNELEHVMEGEFRPNHFQGVCQVVYRLFDLVKPTKAYFGLKDFQQVAVIRYMTNFFNLPVEIVACPTIRETNGLAMSSRNLRLSEEDKKASLVIFNTLKFTKENLDNTATIDELKNKSIALFEQGNLKLEYLEIVDRDTLVLKDKHQKENLVACIAAYCNEVRLIDNMILS
jgi:pantoate--beta-alanine ligase